MCPLTYKSLKMLPAQNCGFECCTWNLNLSFSKSRFGQVLILHFINENWFLITHILATSVCLLLGINLLSPFPGSFPGLLHISQVGWQGVPKAFSQQGHTDDSVLCSSATPEECFHCSSFRFHRMVALSPQTRFQVLC